MMVCGRLLLGYLVAVGVGLIVSRMRMGAVLKPALVAGLEEEARRAENQRAEHVHDDCCGHDHKVNDEGKLVAAFRSTMKDFVDVAVYFSIGVAITALFNTGIAPGAEWLDGLAGNPIGAPMALMVLAFVLSLCSTSDAFIAATLDKFSWGAKLAFLTFGPMMDVKLLFLYQSVLRKRFIIALAAGLFVTIGAAAIFWQEIILKTP